MPEAYWRLYERAEGEPIISECVAILARARTISSVQDEPDGWIMLDAMVQTMLDVGEGRLKLTDNEDY